MRSRTIVCEKPLLEEYKDMLVAQQPNDKPAVSIVISGNRPFEIIEADKESLCGIDGRLSDLDSDKSRSLMPLISDNWRRHFRWQGEGKFPSKQRRKLRRLVRQTHEEGRRIRFWASPDIPAVWQELNAAEADLINTDDLPGLSDFLRTAPD